jgi:prepilin-type N-terminal cleavage/methylation domain-containing protein
MNLHKKGFTLVELAIVIVIIGLLVGGVLTGRELIKQAQIRNNIKRINEITTAAATFLGKYNCIPGDCNKGTSYGLLRNGDGDGKIMLGAYGSNYFWLHLVTARMLNVVSTDGLPFSNTNADMYARFKNDVGAAANNTSTVRSGHMYASYGDIYTNNDPSFPFYSSQVATKTNGNTITITSYSLGGFQANACFTPDETRIMDEKIDDGNALTGKFYGTNARNQMAGNYETCQTAGVYDSDDAKFKCRVIFELGL